MFNSSYSSSGFSSGSYHNPSHSTWSTSGPGSALSTSLVDSLTHSRTHQYQSGYLLSASQHASQGSRKDEPPIVPTDAKMNNILRGSSPGFGTDSMFEPPRLRPNLDDEDAPPMASVTDIPNEARTDTVKTHPQPRNHFAVSTSRRQLRSQQSLSSQQPIYIIVFGYPAEKYAITAEYFKSLGRSTEPEPSSEVMNCFKIGFFDAGEALRAVRKSGDVVSGSWMIGVKFADPSQAEAITGLPAPRLAIGGIPPGDFMAIDESTASSSHAPRMPDFPNLGTPIKLAPSATAFKRSGHDRGSYASRWGVPPIMPPEGVDSAAAPPSKGVVGYVSDLIFGW